MSNISVRATNGAVPYAVILRDDEGHQWVGDEPIENGGGNVGPLPAQLILSGLATCTVITLQMYAKHKQWPLTGVEVEVLWNANGKPADGATEMTRRLVLQGDLSEEQRQRLLQIANACPMHKALTGEIRIATEWGS